MTTVTSVVTSGTGISGGNGRLNRGHVVALTLNMSEAVTVAGGVPTLSLDDLGIAVYDAAHSSSTSPSRSLPRGRRMGSSPAGSGVRFR